MKFLEGLKLKVGIYRGIKNIFNYSFNKVKNVIYIIKNTQPKTQESSRLESSP